MDQLFDRLIFQPKHLASRNIACYLLASKDLHYPNICSYAYSKYRWAQILLYPRKLLKWKFGLLSIRAIISSQNSTWRSKSSSFNSCTSVTLNGMNLFFFNILWTDFILMLCSWAALRRVQWGSSTIDCKTYNDFSSIVAVIVFLFVVDL